MGISQVAGLLQGSKVLKLEPKLKAASCLLSGFSFSFGPPRRLRLHTHDLVGTPGKSVEGFVIVVLKA